LLVTETVYHFVSKTGFPSEMQMYSTNLIHPGMTETHKLISYWWPYAM